jgi:hypothetical protein
MNYNSKSRRIRTKEVQKKDNKKETEMLTMPWNYKAIM